MLLLGRAWRLEEGAGVPKQCKVGRAAAAAAAAAAAPSSCHLSVELSHVAVEIGLRYTPHVSQLEP